MIPARLTWLRDDGDPRVELLSHRLALTERGELERLRLPARRRSFLLSRALLRHTLGTATGLPTEALTFHRTATGRLALSAPAEWHVSLSHAEGLVAVLVARAPCGVDIERPRAIALHRLARRYFAPAEADWLAGRDAATAQRDFLRLWTLKEASVKALGEGLARNMARLAFSLADGTPRPLFTEPALSLRQLPVADAWLAAVVKDAGPTDWGCAELQPGDLLA